MKPIVFAAGAALALLFCGAAQAQVNGPGMAQTQSGRGGGVDAHRMRVKRCFDRQRSPQQRGNSCKLLLDGGTADADATDVALAYTEAGQFDDALAVLAPRLAADPYDPSALTSRAVIHAAQGQYALALTDADLVVKHAPQGLDGAPAYNGRCWVRAIAGQELGAALADCDKALVLDPKDGAVRDSRALVNFKRGDMNAAIADCDAALAQGAASGSDYDYVARLMENDAAVSEFSTHAFSQYLRGLARRRSGDAEGGDKDIAVAKTLDPYVDDEFKIYGVTP